jgi:DinB superfamily
MLTLQEISQKSSEHLNSYLDKLSEFSQEQFSHKSDEETWSLGQLYEHLVTSSTYFLRQAEGCLREDKGSFEGEKTEQGKQIFAFGGFPPVKIKVPEKYKPTSEIVSQGLEHYQITFKDLLEYLPKVEAAIEANSTTYKRQHAIFGMITATEWVWCLETHLRHHLKQLKELEDKALQIDK